MHPGDKIFDPFLLCSTCEILFFLIRKKNRIKKNVSVGLLAKVVLRSKSDYSVSIKIMCAGRVASVLKMVSLVNGERRGDIDQCQQKPAPAT